MEPDKDHICHLSFCFVFCYKKKSAADAHEIICERIMNML